MQAHSTKVQPLTLDNLLEMRRHLAQRLNSMHAEGIAQTAPLQDLYDHCEEAIHHAQVENRITAAHLDAA